MPFEMKRTSINGIEETTIPFESFARELPDFTTWFLDCAPFLSSTIEYFCWFSRFNRSEKQYFTVYFYSSDYEYRIVIDKNSYIGGSYLARKIRPGENYSRGRDLSDGNYSLRTIRAILLEITSHLFEPLDG